jgi:two-component system sensor histidine kinase RpfC
MVGFQSEAREALIPMLHGWGGTAVSVSSVVEAAQRLAAEAGYARAFHSVLVFARDVTGAQQAAAALRRGSPPPMLLCMEAGGMGNGAGAEINAAHDHRMSVAGFAASLNLPVQKRLLFNALHSVSAVEEQSASSGVVQLRDYFNRRDQDNRYRIIVADDSATNRQVIGKILERGGHDVTLVEDGEDVLDALEMNEFDLVILDRNMPGMGGVETLRTIRVMNLGRSNLPVIVLSADVTAETRDDCLGAGADAFLPKPIEAIRLLDAVVALCEGAPAGKRPGAVVTPPAKSFMNPPVNASAPLLNLETLQLLEGLGSQTGFLERLIKVFVSDNLQLLERMDRCVPNRDFAEFRRLLHAMKGSAASMGAEQLALVCSTMNNRTDAEMALQAKLLVGSIQQEFEAVRAELDRYIDEKRRTTG